MPQELWMVSLHAYVKFILSATAQKINLSFNQIPHFPHFSNTEKLGLYFLGTF